MSYLTALHLEQEPFSTSPDPAFFYRSIQHYACLNRVEIAIRLRRGLSLIVGDVGTGKTTLARKLLQNFVGEDDYVFHMILDPSFKTEQQFLAHLTKLFGVTPFFQSNIDYKDAIEQYLFKKGIDEQKTVVLLIDEGQKLSEPILEILRTLLNYETNDHKLLQLVIFSQNEILAKLKNMRNFTDRISLKFKLAPLDYYETSKMIEFRLNQAGFIDGKVLFSTDAVKKIYNYTQGYPRQIARMCHNALEKIIAGDYRSVSTDLVDALIEHDRQWK